MESDRFDALTKQMATAGTSRRRLLRAFGGLVAGAVVTGIGTRTAAADDCSQCGFACPSPTCPWTCCGLREEQQAVQEEEQVIQEEEQLLQTVPPATCKPYNAPCQVNAECCSDFCYNGQICSFPG